MLKFFLGKNLLFLVDFSPRSLDAVADTATLDIEELLATLSQCPNYQLDKHHTNCGIRVRMEPILGYIRVMLTANVIALPHADWKRRRADVSWASLKENRHAHDEDASVKTFAFTRAIANDPRLQYEGALFSDAKAVFTADEWDWTPQA